ncbi:MAG: GNAT family N-acetyltransferase [Clostridia bacterium]|nr:GNAT family N-acetyltransferase [Clostridia bacterium]
MTVDYRQMTADDIEKVIPLYIEYWNSTGDEWTPETVHRRIFQVIGSPDSYCLIAEICGNVIGFAMGRMETFFDLTAYNLVEIVIASEYQRKGYGSALMAELEKRVGALGVSTVQLDAVNDEMHENFYGKLGYKNAMNFVSKFKFIG